MRTPPGVLMTADTLTESELTEQLAALPAEARERIDVAVKLKAPVDDVDPPPGLKFETGLGKIARGERKPPRHIVDGLILEGKLTWLDGHPDSGKSTIAAHTAVEFMHAGGHVVWVDWEAGKVGVVDRLMAAGAQVAWLDEESPECLFHLASFPPLDASPESFGRVAATLGAYPGALVIFDSASKALAAAGLDENNPTEVTRWTTNIAIPTREAGATVVVIDHVTKGTTKDNRYSRGAGSKLADTDVRWYVEAVQPFNRETVGRVELTRKKDRDGWLPHSRLAFEVGDGAGGLPLRQVAVENEETQSKREAGLRGRVLAVLQEHATPDEPRSTSQVVELAHARKGDVLDALGELVKLDGSGVHQTPGGRGSVLYWYDPTTRRDFEAIGEAE